MLSANQRRARGYLAHKTAPLGHQAVYIPTSGQAMLVEKTPGFFALQDQGAHNVRGPDAVLRRNTALQKSIDAYAAIAGLADHRQTSHSPRICARKAIPREKVRTVENEFIDGVAPVLQAGSEGKSLGPEKEGDESSARRKKELSIQKTRALPLPKGSGNRRQGQTLLPQ